MAIKDNEEKIFRHDIKILERLPIKKTYSMTEIVFDGVVLLTLMGFLFCIFYFLVSEILRQL